MNDWFEAGHVAIVTGGSRGLGKALARELLAREVVTIADGRDRDALAEAARDLAPFGRLVPIAGDVTDDGHVHALIAAARERGRLDLLINNASSLGETPLPDIERLGRGAFTRAFETNTYAPIHLIRHALPLLRRSAYGTIVNVTSDAAVEAHPGWAAYGASKAALEHVSRVLAAELRTSSVRVLVADPGDMDTQMHRDAIPDADPSELRDPAQVARALLHAVAAMREPFERVRLADEVTA